MKPENPTLSNSKSIVMPEGSTAESTGVQSYPVMANPHFGGHVPVVPQHLFPPAAMWSPMAPQSWPGAFPMMAPFGGAMHPMFQMMPPGLPPQGVHIPVQANQSLEATSLRPEKGAKTGEVDGVSDVRSPHMPPLKRKLEPSTDKDSDDLDPESSYSEVSKDGKGFVCTYGSCTRKFARKSVLKFHIRAVHFGSKDFRCTHPGCNKEFGQKSDLSRHIHTVHERLKEFKCPIEKCTWEFGQKGNMIRHVASVHKLRWKKGKLYPLDTISRTDSLSQPLEKHKASLTSSKLSTESNASSSD